LALLVEGSHFDVTIGHLRLIIFNFVHLEKDNLSEVAATSELGAHSSKRLALLRSNINLKSGIDPFAHIVVVYSHAST
jgi:hypothetical protein